MGLHALLTAHFALVCNAILYLKLQAKTFVQNIILNGQRSIIDEGDSHSVNFVDFFSAAIPVVYVDI